MKLELNHVPGFCLTLLISFWACHSAPREQIAAEKDFTFVFGSGGGFTGMAEGYIIHGDGKIEKWSGLHFRRSKIEVAGVAAPEALQPLRQMFASRIFAQWSYRETGNMTTQVWCISGNDTITVSWPGLQPGEGVPPAIQDFYRKLVHAVQSASK